MDNLINRQAAIDAILSIKDYGNSERANALGLAEFAVTTLPSAQPETARRIVGKSMDGMTLWYQCDMCNEPVDKQDVYCRGCGRRFVDE